ncbi:MAG TPA: phage tail tape measure protein [Pseudolabrys sp.]
MSSLYGNLTSQTNALTASANNFSSAMTRAFTQATAGGKQLDSVLQSLALRISSLAVSAAFKPIASGITGAVSGGLTQLFGGVFGGAGNGPIGNRLGAIKPFASGGVIGTPTYFPMSSGGLGLAGEAGPEAIMPLSRGSDGKLGVAMSGAGQPANISVHIATPDVGSFRRSEAYLTGQIARAVARGQRSF